MAGERKQLPFREWPPDIRRRWEAAFVKGDFLDEGGPGAHLAAATRADLQFACASFFRYLRRITACTSTLMRPRMRSIPRCSQHL